MYKITLSIITVNFNNNQGLRKTLHSIKLQSFPLYEHIIIDAGSTDGSKETIIQYQKETSHLSFWSSEPDKGIYDGMNKGIDHAKGEYLYFLNSGDCLSQEILSKISFDGTEYLYGDTVLYYKRKNKKRIYPDALDLIYLSDNSLHHQSCFIHHRLFKNKRYDTNYKIISDWAHCFQCIIIENCSYRHIPLIISECDGEGVSSNGKALNQERILWFQNSFPPRLSKTFIDCATLDRSGFRDVIYLLANTRRFKKRMKALILFFYKINSFFSFKSKHSAN